jgi:hypothetical protein
MLNKRSNSVMVDVSLQSINGGLAGMTHRAKFGIAALSAALMLGLQLAAPASAQEREHFGRPGGPRGQVLDSRYNHGHYYPAIGASVRVLPDGYRPYYMGGRPFYFVGGVWYAPGGPGFVVIRPPIGLSIAVLPPYYSTVWFAGVPYYYADDVYYTWNPAQNGYVVVNPPENADQPSTPPPTAQGDLIIYPKNGQTTEQQAADRYECHRWAKGQSGFDPTEAGGGANPGARSAYDRAISACLTGRGYEVK